MRNFLKVSAFLILLGIIVLLGFLFIPRSYDVLPFQERPGTQYWDLPTGSHIGYSQIPAKGEKKSTPIIYLHGGPGGRVTDETIAVLGQLANKGYDLYFYDQIGSGHSARLEDITEYTIERHQWDLAAIIGKIGAQKVILIGHSWGAILAATFMAEHADRVEKIVFTGPGPIPPIRRELATVPPPDSLNLQPPPTTNQQANAQAQNLRSRLMTKWAYLFGNKLASDREADAFMAHLFGHLNQSAVVDAATLPEPRIGAGYYAHIMTYKSFFAFEDQRSQIKNDTLPVLLLRGQYDNQKWGYAEEYLALFPNHKLVIVPNAGHFMELEQPALYLQAITTFLNQ